MLVELDDVKRKTPVTKLALYLGWVILAVLNVLDVWSTHALLNSHQVLAEEANPIARWLIDHSLFLPIKMLAVISIGYYCIKTDSPKRLAIMLWLIVPLYLFVVAHNISYM